MGIVRTILAVFVALGLTLSPVAADLARAQMAQSDHQQMMSGAQSKPDQRLVSADQDDCTCCKGAAKCPPAFCAAICAGTQAALAGKISLPKPLRAALSVEPLAMMHWPTSPPDPPPPRV